MREHLASEAIAHVMPKESFGQTLTYLRNQFEHLLAHLDDGLTPINNNETAQLMKQVALGLTNQMFIGSVDAGYLAAVLMTLVSTAARHDLNISFYVKHVLDRLLAGDTDYKVLWPDACMQSHPEAVRLYRVEARQASADAQAVTRARRRLTKTLNPGGTWPARAAKRIAVACAHSPITAYTGRLRNPAEQRVYSETALLSTPACQHVGLYSLHTVPTINRPSGFSEDFSAISPLSRPISIRL